jgi:hypothetical protein
MSTKQAMINHASSLLTRVSRLYSDRSVVTPISAMLARYHLQTGNISEFNAVAEDAIERIENRIDSECLIAHADDALALELLTNAWLVSNYAYARKN